MCAAHLFGTEHSKRDRDARTATDRICTLTRYYNISSKASKIMIFDTPNRSISEIDIAQCTY